MAMGKRKRKLRQQSIWIATQDLPRSGSHPFYMQLNRILERNGFDDYVEELCATFYAPTMGRPSLTPGRYFRLLMLGYFEEIESERGIAWRAADSLSVRAFLGLELDETPADHSTISRTRRLIDVETHRAVFSWILERLSQAGLVNGQTVGIDATTLEANAALRSIVRRDTGESYEAFLMRLAKASGIATPTREELARLDRKRPNKGSNDDWTHPHDPDARITKMKDGRTHLAHQAEHAVDFETGAVVAVTIQPADQGDTETVKQTLITAAENVEKVKPQSHGVQELIADKGYHSNDLLKDLRVLGIRTYVCEPAGGRRNWENDPDARDAVYANRRRIGGKRGRRLLRQRGECLERPFAHAYQTGGLRRVYLRGRFNILKRVLIHVAALNLGLLMRVLFGAGTPRSLQGRLSPLVARLFILCRRLADVYFPRCFRVRHCSARNYPHTRCPLCLTQVFGETIFTTGC